MKKFLLLILILFFTPQFSLSDEAKTENFIVKDSFIPVYPVRTFSTSLLDENDTFYFIVPSDLWVNEYKAIPKNSIIKARISMLKMPVTGINAAVRIDTELVIFPDGTRHAIKGAVTRGGERQIGGDLAPPLSYNKSFHLGKGEYFDAPFAQYVPSGEYEFGQHITIPTSEMLQVVLDEDFYPI